MLIESSDLLYNDVGSVYEELSEALLSKLKLETEIQLLLQSISSGPCGSLSILPVELLTEIFNPVVAANPMHRTRLMLVCRSWARIIVKAPQLWTNIKIIAPIEPEKVKQCASYCAKCVERSGTLPLDIDIRYTGFRALPEHFWQPLGAACAATFGDPHLQSRWKSPYLNRFSCFYEALDRGDDAFFKYHRERYLAPLRIFSGKSFSVMRRWKSFSLVSGKVDWGRSIFSFALNANLFGGPTPLLQRLILKYIPGYTPWGDERRDCLFFTDSRPLSFPFLPKISELLLINVDLPLQFGNIDPTHIEKLSIHTPDQFPFTCNNLVTLRLGFFYIRGVQFIPGTSPVVFPFLNRLEINTYLAPAFWERIVAPTMTEIVFEGGLSLGLGNGVMLPPSTSRVECRWIQEPRELEELLFTILQCPSLNTLLITRSRRDHMVRIIEKLRDGGIPIPTVISVPYNYDTVPWHEEILPLG